MKVFLILIIATVVAAVSLMAINPVISTLASPRWEVWVVDENGHPLQGMNVRLSWANYSVEHTENQEDLRTNESGYVVFPAKTSKASLNETIAGTMESFRGFPHSSFGPHAYVFAFGNRREGRAVNGEHVTDWTGRPHQMQSRIIAKPMGQ